MAEEKDKTLKDAVEQIPVLIKFLREAIHGKFAEVKASDGTVFIYNGDFKVGVDVFIDGKQATDEKYNKDYETDTHKFTVKAGKVIDYKEKEKPAPAVPSADEFKAALKETIDSYELKLAAQKTDFEGQIKKFKEELDKKIDDLLGGKLKEIFELVNKMASLPQVDSQFKKKDGEQVITPKTTIDKLMAEAKKQITDKVFKS